MHFEKKEDTVTTEKIGDIEVTRIEHGKGELVLNPGDTLDNLTQEQKDALLEQAFLPNGDHPIPPPNPVTYTPEDYIEIQKDVVRLNPIGPAAGTVHESPLRVASKSLVGPPVGVPDEKNVTVTRVDSGASDNVPPAFRKP